MKRTITLFMLIVSVIFGLMAFRYFQTPAFYYAFDEKVSTTPLESKILVKYSVARDQKSAGTLIQNIEKNAELNWQDDKVVIIDAKPGQQKKRSGSAFWPKQMCLASSLFLKLLKGLN